MATYETSKSAVYGTSYAQGQARQLIVDAVVVAVTTAMSENANDDVGLLWVPKGAVICAAEFRCTDMDSSTGLVWDIGDSGDEDRIIAASAVGQTAARSDALAEAGLLYKYTARTQIRAYINTAVSGTPAAGTLYFWIAYFIDENWDRTALTAA